MPDDARLTLILDANLDKLRDSLNRAGDYSVGFANKAQRALDEVKAKIDPVGVAAGKMSQQIALADKFFAAGALSATQHAKALELARLEYDRLTGAVEKTRIAEALEATVARARLGVIEEGSVRFPIFAGLLEALGPAGLAAAGGLAAVGIAAEGAKKALEYGEDLEKTSRALGTTTTFVQEFDRANAASGITVAAGRESLKSFVEILGKYSTGLASGKQAKWFDALGFTPASARDLGAINTSLDLTLRKLASIQNPTQRNAFAQQLGLQAFLPLLAEGEEGIDRFEAKMKEAYANGEILRPDQVTKLAALNEKLGELSDRIETDFRNAFVDLAPTILQVAEFMERAAKAASSFVANIPNVARGVQAQTGAPTGGGGAGGFLGAVGNLYGGLNSLEARTFGLPVQAGVDYFNKTAAQGQRAKMLDAIEAGLKNGVPDLKSLAQVPAGEDYKPPGNTRAAKAAPTDTFAQDFQKASENVANEAKALAQAQANLTTDIDARAEFERQAVVDERDKAIARLTAEEESIRAKQGLTDGERAQLISQNEIAKLTAGEVAAAKMAKINRDADTASEAKNLANRQAIDRFYDTILQNTAALARTSAERRDAELASLAQQKKEQDDAREARRKADYRAAGTDQERYNVNNQAAAEKKSADDAYGSNVTKIIKENESALDKWRDDTLRNAGEVQDALEKAGVAGFDSFNSGAADAIVNGKSLGDVMHNVFATMEADAIRYLLKQAEIGVLGGGGGGAGALFSSLIGAFFPGAGAIASAASNTSTLDLSKASVPHFASGGFVTGAGGPTSDNIPALLSPGEFVLSNDMLRGMRNMSGPRAQASAAPILNFDLRGAVMTSDLLAQMQRIGNEAAASGTVNGAAIGSANAQQRMAKSGARRLGR